MSKKKPLTIDMLAGAQVKDIQNEILDIEGADISELEAGRGLFNDNHSMGYINTIGRITAAKKIFKEEDCEDDRHRYYWDKVKSPFIYARGVLFDDDDHPNARAAAAIIRNIHRDDCPLKVKASVEGGVLARGISDPSILKRTKITKIALTFTPANQVTLVEPLDLDKSSANWDRDQALIKSVEHLAKSNVPTFKQIARRTSAEIIADNMIKINGIIQDLGVDVGVKVKTVDDLVKMSASYKLNQNIKKINELIKNASSFSQVEVLQKASKKQLQEILGASDPEGETANWISQNLKRDDLAIWAARAHKENPGVLNDANKATLVHHASMANLFNSSLRLDKKHDFKTGMELLKEDADKLNDQHAVKNKMLKPEGEKIIDLGNGKAWYSLGRGSCESEGRAMLHCGNQGSRLKGDNILSLRQDVKDKQGNIRHQPLITVVENGGYIGESKGPSNNKPTDKDAMAALIRHSRIKGVIGGGYAPESNFHVEDLSPKHQKELGHKFHQRFESTRPFAEDVLDNERFGRHATTHNKAVEGLKQITANPDSIKNMPVDLQWNLIHHKNTPSDAIDSVINQHPDLFNKKHRADAFASGRDPDTLYDKKLGFVESTDFAENIRNEYLFNKLKDDPNMNLRSGYPRSKHFKPEHMEQALNDTEYNIRANAVASKHFKPEHMEQALNDPHEEIREAAVKSKHFKPEHMEQALNDTDKYVRETAVKSKHFKPEHMEQALNDPHEEIREAAVKSDHFKPEYMEQALNDPRGVVRYAAVKSKHFKPEHMEQALSNSYESARRAAVASKHFKPEHMEQALNDSFEGVRYAAVASDHFKPEHMEQALNDPREGVREVALEKQKQFALKKTIIGNIKKINELTKALSAGYGGAGAPTSRTQGAVLQSESVEGARGFQYIACDNCGSESVYMKHQTKCRSCGKSYAFDKLLKFLVNKNG